MGEDSRFEDIPTSSLNKFYHILMANMINPCRNIKDFFHLSHLEYPLFTFISWIINNKSMMAAYCVTLLTQLVDIRENELLTILTLSAVFYFCILLIYNNSYNIKYFSEKCCV